MEWKSTTSKLLFPLVNLSLLFIFLFPLQCFAQTRVFANQVVAESRTDFSERATDGDLSTSANVRASSGVLLGAGAYSGYIELQYPETVPANTTSFVKIATDDNLLPALLGGSLGTLLSDVLGGVLIGNQEFTIQAKNGNSVVLQGNSQVAGDFANENLRIVTDATDQFYVAITPNVPYK